MNVAALHNAFVLTLAVATIAFTAVRSNHGGAFEAGASGAGPVAAIALAETDHTSVPSAVTVFAAHSASDETVSATF
jgi:hypothetical protein